MINLVKFLFLGCLFLSSSGCVTIFSDFQSARTLGEGNNEITANISGVNYSDIDDGEGGYQQTNIGVQFGVGLNETVDLRARIENMNLYDASDAFKFYAIGIGPKFSVIEDRLAIYTPVGLAFGEDIESVDTIEFHPTLIYSIPISEEFEINTSGKYIFTLQDGRDNSIAFNFGIGIYNDVFVFRPEMGFMIYPADTDFILFHFGTGFSYKF